MNPWTLFGWVMLGALLVWLAIVAICIPRAWRTMREAQRRVAAANAEVDERIHERRARRDLPPGDPRLTPGYRPIRPRREGVPQP